MENETNSTPVPTSVPVAPATVTTVPAAPTAPSAPVFDPRRRIRELLSIPDRDRTDAEWDELNELEIQTAPGNRSSGQLPAAYAGKQNNFSAKNRQKGKGPHNRSGGGGARPQQTKQGNNTPQKPRPS